MNMLAVALGCCLLAQQPAEQDPFRPQVVPGKRPPVAIDDGPTPAKPAAPTADQPTKAGDPSVDPQGAPKPTTPDPAAPDNDPLGPGTPTPAEPDPGLPRDATAPVTPIEPAADATGSNLAPVDGARRQRLRPPELVAEALTTPREGALEGTPLELVAALSGSTDRQQQLEVARAYWRLASAQANYHWALEERDLLNRYAQSQANLPAVLGAQSTASANVRDAQLAVALAQQQLADLLGGSGGLPLTVDRPHVGSYNTLFDEFFVNRQAPARLRLIHRALPLRREAIDAHGAAIVATLDAVAATGEQFATSGQGLATLLSLFEQLHDERQAFISAVRDYNQDIAEYLFAVARPGTSEQVLVSRLILTSNRPSPPANNPAPPSQGDTPGGAGAESTQQPALDDAAGIDPQSTNYQPEDVDDMAGGELYRALLDLEPPACVQKLSGLLHWDRALPPDAGQGAALADCLRNASPGDRLTLLAAYWQARECAARYQALNDQVEQLNALSRVAIALHEEPGMDAAGVRLQAARRAAAAALVESQLALVQAQFELTQLAGRPLDQPWLLPATLPQSGRYNVADHAAGPARRLAAAVSMRHAELQERADAVIRADEVRATLGGAAVGAGASATASATGDELSSLDRAAWAVARETDQVLAFLRNLTNYNMAIARYALVTTPQEVPGGELVKKLVIERFADSRT